MNTFGTLLRLTTFGESHGPAMGGIIDGMPAGIHVDEQLLHTDLLRRRPGQSSLTTQREEKDEVECLSGIYQGQTTGQPIGFIVRNTGQRSADYDSLREVLRPSHADYTYWAKYGLRDHRGGGRASARETVCRIVGGAFAKMLLRQAGISIHAYTQQVGDITLTTHYSALDLTAAEHNDVRCPDPSVAQRMADLITEVRLSGDTIGGCVACIAKGCPAGLGDPVFGKAQARLAEGMLSIPAAHGFEYGEGFAAAAMRGSDHNDGFTTTPQGQITTTTNHSGGIQGGITNGQDIYFRVAFKPVATLMQPQDTIDLHGRRVTLQAAGRHDPCVVPRAVPIVEAMAALTLADLGLRQHIFSH